DPPPHFDLVIVDEAHHIRNPGTNSHELARLLCDVSEAVIFLSATPVHLGSSNLYSLLNLLRPDVFPDEAVFDEILEPNQYLTEAMRHVRTRTPEGSWSQAAAADLTKVVATSYGRSVVGLDERFQLWRRKLEQAPIASDAERMRCLRDLEELHSLAHVMNRTRRRDIGQFTVREPHTVAPPSTVVTRLPPGPASPAVWVVAPGAWEPPTAARGPGSAGGPPSSSDGR
ncbi:MAG: hypothetical protein JOZ41_04540, partial [Chloroflexi bacterium]|nr:hypothetical protein [Chloroflexota bacterium]